MANKKKKKTNDGKLLFILLASLIGFLAFGIYVTNRNNVTEIAKVEEETAKAFTKIGVVSDNGIVYHINDDETTITISRLRRR